MSEPKLTREEIEEARVRLEGWSVPTIDALCDMALLALSAEAPAQGPENFMYFDIECQRKGCQALVIAAQAKRIEGLERGLAEEREINDADQVLRKEYLARAELAEALVGQLQKRIAQWEGDGIEKDAAIGALQQAVERLQEPLGDVLAEIDNAKLTCQDPHAITLVWARDSALEADIRGALSGHAHALQQALQDVYEQCALACIDMPQQGGSTYTYWPCVNAIRALGHAHAQTEPKERGDV